jgi:mRNA interferase RelE/StbE
VSAQYKVEFTGKAAKELRKLDRASQKRIANAVRGLADEPRPSGVTELTRYAHTYRIRVGDFRVIYDVFDDTLLIEIIRVRDRKDAYKGI